MAATTAHHGYNDASASRMSKPVVASLIFHGLILLFAIVGLPYITKPPPEIDQPIPIEMVNAPVAEIAHVTKPPSSPARVNVPKPVDKQPPKPVPPTKTTEEPPKPVAPKPPEPVKTEAHPEQVEDALAPPDKLLKKLKTPAKKTEKPAEKKPEKKVDPTPDFQNAVLKNLIKEDSTAANDNTPVKENTPPTPQATLSDQMTMSEMDGVRRQLGECWKLLAGARYAEDLVVEIQMTMTPDKHVANAQIVDQIRYNSDTFFRAAADSALRAVYDPRCNPLTSLPDGKYNMWKDLDIDFDPRQMLQ
jgi:hypothetical protein